VHDRVDMVRVGTLELRLERPNEAEVLEAALREDAFEPPYWAEIWPSGLALAGELAERDLSGMRVIELGCGLALPSLAAKARGATVLATDRDPQALEYARRNGLETMLVDLSDPPPLPRFDLAIGADVLYEHVFAEGLAELLPRLADELLIAVPNRPKASERADAIAPGWTRVREQSGAIELLTLRRPV
jgi:predicted nicotinamide N-methyase